jgi:hypothetical protein
MERNKKPCRIVVPYKIMPTQSQLHRKESVLSALIEARQNILAEVSKLSEAQQDQIFLGIWSVKDLLAHLIGWDETNLRAAKSILKGQVPSFYKHSDRDWQTYNATLVKKHKKDSLPELIAGARNSQKELIEFLQSIPPESFNRDFGVRFHGYKVTIQRLLEAETKDEQTHQRQITDFFKESK